MIATILDAAARSLLLAILVWTGLRIFRVRNVLAQRSVWAAVLASALLMPAALPISARWDLLPKQTLVIPSEFVPMDSPVQQEQPAASTTLLADDGTTTVLTARRATESEPGLASQKVDSLPAPASFTLVKTAVDSSRQFVRNLRPAAWVELAIGVYLMVAGGFLVRLFCGLAAILRLWRGSRPAQLDDAFDRHAGLNVRYSPNISSPVTIGSGVLLPEDYVDWDQEKLRIVLAHERAHVCHGDFYWQMLASLYAALTWFSPLGWWLKRKLSDLGEAISDHAGLEEARNRSAYARILLEFAAAPQPNFTGVAMARKSNISLRIERLLNERVFRQAFAGSRRVRIAFLLVPLALFAGMALVRVQAAGSSTPEMLAFINPLDLIPAPTAAVPPATKVPVHAAVVASHPPDHAAAAAVQQPAAAAETSQADATFDRTLTVSGKIELSVATGSGNIRLTHGSGSQVQIHGHVHSRDAAEADKVHEIATNPPIEQNGSSISIGKQHEQGTNHISIDYEIVAPADAMLSAATGSGNVTDEGVGQGARLMTGSGNITASGLQGGFKTQTGSGNIVVENAGEGAADAQTGSGTIDIKGVHGSLKAQTGSGGIKAEGTPSAEWKLGSGSGGIELSTGNAAMTLDASTGSGKITTATGVAMGNSSDHHHVHVELNGGGPQVKVETGSGNIHIQ